MGGIRAAEILRVESGDHLAVDQQSVAAENHRGFHSVALPDGGDEIPNARHSRSLESVGEGRDRRKRSQATPIA